MRVLREHSANRHLARAGRKIHWTRVFDLGVESSVNLRQKIKRTLLRLTFTGSHGPIPSISRGKWSLRSSAVAEQCTLVIEKEEISLNSKDARSWGRRYLQRNNRAYPGQVLSHSSASSFTFAAYSLPRTSFQCAVLFPRMRAFCSRSGKSSQAESGKRGTGGN